MANANAISGGLTLDDVSPGQRFTSASHRIDANQIKAFAKEFDPQPFHLDEEAAKDTFFGGLAASGWHVAAITMKLLVGDAAPFEAASSAPGPRLPGRNQPGPATF
jgi:acyl dehydratase